MWHNEDDLLKDLIYLNDFGNSGDKESYKVLYSKGRGTNFKKKLEYSETFVDCRTGETINLNDINFDTIDNLPKKGRGRGSVSKSLAKTKLQLQKQLRMARPLGSGDNAIETYCRRNKPPDSTDKSLSSETHKTEDNEPDTKNLFYSHRVKATRNSSTQSNALIQSLLAKTESENTLKQNANKNTYSNEKNSLERFKIKVKKDKECNRKSQETECIERIVNAPMKTSEKSDDGCVENINYNVMNDSEEESDTLSFSDCSEEFNTKNENSMSESSHVTSRSSSPAQKRNRSELYRKLGEKLNRYDEIQKNTFGRGNYDFSNAVRYISTVDNKYE